MNKLIELTDAELYVLVSAYESALSKELGHPLWMDGFERACQLVDMLPDAPSYCDTFAELTT